MFSKWRETMLWRIYFGQGFNHAAVPGWVKRILINIKLFSRQSRWQAVMEGGSLSTVASVHSVLHTTAHLTTCRSTCSCGLSCDIIHLVPATVDVLSGSELLIVFPVVATFLKQNSVHTVCMISMMFQMMFSLKLEDTIQSPYITSDLLSSYNKNAPTDTNAHVERSESSTVH